MRTRLHAATLLTLAAVLAPSLHAQPGDGFVPGDRADEEFVEECLRDWMVAVLNENHAAYTELLHAEALQVPEFAAEAAMEFWAGQMRQIAEARLRRRVPDRNRDEGHTSRASRDRAGVPGVGPRIKGRSTRYRPRGRNVPSSSGSSAENSLTRRPMKQRNQPLRLQKASDSKPKSKESPRCKPGCLPQQY